MTGKGSFNRKFKVVFGCGFCKETLNIKKWEGDTWKGYFICHKCMKILNQAKKTGTVRKSKRAALLLKIGMLKRKKVPD